MYLIHSADIIHLFDMIGVAACTIAATIMAKRNNSDLIGAIFISFVASVGGGTLRDVLLGNHPIFWIKSPEYIYLIIIISIIIQIFFNFVEQINKPLRMFDALGAATFTVIGVETALALDAPPIVAILMGISTATVGGICRDVISNEIPLILKKEVYITPCLVGAMLYFPLQKIVLPEGFHQFIVIATIFSLRMLAIRYNWQLPNITINK